MSPPYIPLYVDDYDAATAHLSVEEDGVYGRLLRLCWRSPNCSIPADYGWIARKIRMSGEDFERVARPVITEFFTLSRGRLSQKRLRAEWLKYADKTLRRAEAGRKGGLAKAQKEKDIVPSNATTLPWQPEPEPEPEEIDTVVSRAADATPAKSPTLPGEFAEAWKACTPAMRKRSLSLAKTLPHWSLAARLAGSPGVLLASLRRYLRDDPDIGRTGGPGFHLWLRDGTWEHYLTSPDAAAADATQAEASRRVRHWQDTGEWRSEWGQHPAKAAA